ncbi:hypothetical protein Sgleb_60080 [Streptomyces glebosus]|uniref:Uncharacterized protein n=1 Tax=Streptomyces glebosus TaxID=249580 RepID=A0A640T625_9ACTN|nr:hypothetical protein Sgleb_60080 [Streptomyces glebosus]GHG46869.1 hypothetical protein GCM10010513_02920 [Streptomyces glebosus]
MAHVEKRESACGDSDYERGWLPHFDKELALVSWQLRKRGPSPQGLRMFSRRGAGGLFDENAGTTLPTSKELLMQHAQARPSPAPVSRIRRTAVGAWQ